MPIVNSLRAAAAALIALAAPGAAFAQSGLMRSETGAATGAIQSEIRTAVRPQLKISNSAGAITGLAISADGSTMAIVPSDRSLRLWDLPDGLQEARYPLTDAAAAMALSNEGTVIASASGNGSVRLWDDRSGGLTATAAGNFPVTALALAADRHGIAAGTADGRLVYWASPQAAPVAMPTTSSAIVATAFNRAGQIVAVGDDGATYAWDGKSSIHTGLAIGQIAAAGLSDDGQIAVVSDPRNHLKFIDLPTGRVLQDVAVVPGSARHLAVDLAHRRVMTGGNDGIIRVRNLNSGELLVEIISTLSGWSAIDAQGRFDGTIAGVDDIKWLASELKLPIDNFSQPYFEPGLVARYIRQPSGFVAPAPTPVFGGIALPPKVSVMAQPGPAGAEVSIVAEDQGGGIGSINLFQNGKLVPPDRQTGEHKAVQNGAARTTRTYQVALAAGVNHFDAVAASTTQIEGEHATADLTFATAPALPTLHILTIGINKYRDPRFDLDYGVNDAVSIVQSLQASRGVFSNVVSESLTDAAATRGAIVQALTDLQRAPADDVLVVYLAGHGEIEGTDWYFLPHDVVFTPQGIEHTAISASEMRDLLSRVGPQRVLILIDSCKSGGSIDTLATAIDRKLLRSLGREAGVAILAGARRDQFAEEFPQLHHGAFTYVVLQGIDGKADEHRNGRITSDELLTYSTSELPLLTKELINQMQIPVGYTRGQDFLVHHSGG